MFFPDTQVLLPGLQAGGFSQAWHGRAGMAGIQMAEQLEAIFTGQAATCQLGGLHRRVASSDQTAEPWAHGQGKSMLQDEGY